MRSASERMAARADAVTLYSAVSAAACRGFPLPNRGRLAVLYLWLFLGCGCEGLRITLPPPNISIPKFFANGTLVSPACSSKYLCHNGTQDVIECSCHPNCFLFNDCCQDEIRPEKRALAFEANTYTCELLIALTRGKYSTIYDKTDATYIVNRCPSYFDTPRVSELCSHPLSLPANATLSEIVTDGSRGVTYRNVFCAFCHGADLDRLVHWTPVIACSNETYYGLSGCSIAYLPPQNTTVQLSGCADKAISNCSANSTLAQKNACMNNPTRYVHDNNNHQTYRNWNCTECNAEEKLQSPDWLCTRTWNPGYNGAPNPPSLDFTVLLVPMRSCPQRITFFMSAYQRSFWTKVCPRIPFDTSNCSESVTGTLLESLYKSNVDAEHGMSSNSVWLRYNTSYVACTQCKNMSHRLPPGVSSESTNVTVNNVIYVQPFFTVVDNATLLVCTETSETGTLPTDSVCTALPSEVTIVFMALSLFGLVLYAVAYGMLQSLRNLPGQIVLHQSSAFFAGFLIFLLRRFAGVPEEACTAVAILVHFFFLAAFTWTSVYAIEVVRALGFQAYGTGFTMRRVRYIVAGWLVPAIVTAAGIATDFSTSDNPYRPAYGPPECFIGNAVGQRIFFIAPLAVFLSIDIVIYIYVIVKLVLISDQTKMVRESHHEKLFLAAKLIFALGITWIFAVLASVTGNCVLTYLFTLLNTLQGAFIFVIFVCNSKITGQLHQKLRGQKSTTSGTGTGTTFHGRDSTSSSAASILSKRKSVLGVQSFSPVALAVHEQQNASRPR